MGTTCMETKSAATTKPASAASSDPQRLGAWYWLAAATCSGLFLFMCFHPLALGTYLGWIALILFLVLVRSQARPRFIYFCALMCGLAFFVPALSWMRVADRAMVTGWLGLSLYCA